jgi:hypothetical protein
LGWGKRRKRRIGCKGVGKEEVERERGKVMATGREEFKFPRFSNVVAS